MMTSIDRKDDLVSVQEKLEWVAPQISLMGGTDATEGKPTTFGAEFRAVGGTKEIGPS